MGKDYRRCSAVCDHFWEGSIIVTSIVTDIIIIITINPSTTLAITEKQTKSLCIIF